MKDAPFSITAVLLAILVVTAIMGGIFALVLGAMGIAGFWGIFIAAFLTVPIGSLVRQATASNLAAVAGVSGKIPFAFSLPVRLVIGAIAAAIIAYVLNASAFYGFGFIVGALAALLTSVILMTVFYLTVATRK